MMKYYWYIPILPTTKDYSFARISIRDVKRSTTQPSGNEYYITETIDGYRHIIKDKSGNSPITQNDFGKVEESHKIDDNISSMLVDKWEKDRRKYLADIQEESEIENKLYNTNRYLTPEMQESLMLFARKRKSTKQKLVRKSPIKQIIKKAIRKVKRR